MYDIRRTAHKLPEGKKDLLNGTPILGSIALLPRTSLRPVLCQLLELCWIVSRIFLYRYKSPRFVYSFALAQDLIHIKRRLRKLFTRDELGRGACIEHTSSYVLFSSCFHNLYLPWCVYPSVVVLCAEDEFTLSRVHPASTFRTRKNRHTCYDISIT